MQLPLVKLLTARSQAWCSLILPGKDEARRELILGMVTDAVGLSSMMTEQSKEQEQEKEQEQGLEREQEQGREQGEVSEGYP